MDTYLSDFVYNFISCSFRLMCANLQEFMRFLISTFSSFFFFIKNQHRFFPISRFLKSSQFSFHFTPILIQLGLQIEQLQIIKQTIKRFFKYLYFIRNENFCFPSNFGIKHLPNILIFRRIKIRISKLPSSISYFHASWSRYRVEDIFFTGD